MNGSKEEQFEIQVSLPDELRDDDLVRAVGVGLYHLAVGYSPKETITKGRVVNKRIRLSKQAKIYFDQLTPEYETKKGLIIAALSWLKEQPKWMRSARI